MAEGLIFYNVRSNPAAHLPTLRAARDLGYHVLLVTNLRKLDVSRSLVHAVRYVDTFDVPQALEAGRVLAREHKVAGVISWRDQDVATAASLADELGLPGPPPYAAALTRDKYAMREALAHLLDAGPRFARVRMLPDALAAAARVGFPAILKPTVAMGSIGVFEVSSEGDLRDAFTLLSAYVRAESHPVFRNGRNELILEEFITGTEHSVEGYIHHGDVYIAGITDKTTLAPHHLEKRHVFPSALPEAVQVRTRAFTARIVDALGLDNCAFHLECKVQAERTVLIEVAARTGGDYITSHLVPLATGVDFCANTLRVATGERPVATNAGSSRYWAGVSKIVAPSSGALAGLKGIERALAIPGVEFITVERELGDHIETPPQDFMGCVLGSVIARAATRGELVASLDSAEGAIVPQIE